MTIHITASVRIYTAYTSGQIGLWIIRAVLLYDAFESGDTQLLAILVFALFLPLVIGSHFIAPRFERWSQRAVMGSVEFLRILLICALIFSDSSYRALLSPVIIFCLGLAQPVFVSAQVAYLRAVNDDSQFPYSLGMLANIERFTNILGLTVGALILAALSIPEALALALFFLLFSSAIYVFLLPVSVQDTIINNNNNFVDKINMLFLFMSIFLLNLGAGVINLFQIIATLDIYDTGPHGLALMFLIVSIFGLVGAMLAGRAVSFFGASRAAICAAIGVGLSLACMVMPMSLVWSASAGGIMLAFGQIFAVATQTMIIVQYPVNQSVRGSARFQSLTFGGIATNALAYFILSPFMPFLDYVAASALVASLAVVTLVLHSRCARARSTDDSTTI